ncbi:MAG TPA: TIGR03118 family protein, partial [Solirubrobacteraceae bacterium]|nr:TIGR03118 family protein [Solirubrobacteraceae bacterium]
MRSSPRAHLHGRRSRRWWGAVALVAVVALALVPSALAHRGHRDAAGRGIGHFAQRNLVSDIPGAAELPDADLVNAWGLTFGPTTPAWVADNGTDVSTLYSGAVGGTPVAKSGLTVSIPGGAPTGAVFNGNPNAFVVRSGASSGSARFLFASEAGIISGWNPAVPAPPPSPSTQAQVAVPVPGAIFKGLAI